jgi:flagellar protein FliS
MFDKAYNIYKKQSITTLTPIEIIVRLYDECEKQLRLAREYIAKKDFLATNTAIMKAYDIVSALQNCLDMKVPISRNLDALYNFFKREILAANMKKSAEKIDELLPLIDELRSAFVEISHMSKEDIAKQAAEAAETIAPSSKMKMTSALVSANG